MKFSKLASTLSVALIASQDCSFRHTLTWPLAQSRRQPPTSTEKKNKRPPEPGEQQPEQKPEEPIPTTSSENFRMPRRSRFQLRSLTSMRWSITRKAGRS